ncbi:hypothetical protein SAMN04487913_110139 [Arthrobacter sp. ok362]|nr:hypothetical protein SAMN04487913_110139 [Arthrobacter sp. ok362]
MDMPYGRGLPGRTCPFLLSVGHAPPGAGGPEGHAHSLVRPVDTWASCSLPALSIGHALRPRAAEWDMSSPSAERWTCPTGPGRARGTCPFFGAAGGHLGIMLSARAEGWTCPIGAGCPGGHVHSCYRGVGMSRGPRGPVAAWTLLARAYSPARSSKSTSWPSSSSVSCPSSFRCRYISTVPAAASRIPAMRKMMPPSRAAA